MILFLFFGGKLKIRVTFKINIKENILWLKLNSRNFRLKSCNAISFNESYFSEKIQNKEF